jgi:hypothetical protein
LSKFREIYLRQALALYGPEDVLKRAKGLNILQSLAQEYNCSSEELPYTVLKYKDKGEFLNAIRNKDNDTLIAKLREATTLGALMEYEIQTERYDKINFFKEKYYGEEQSEDLFSEFIQDMLTKKLLIPTSVEKTITLKDGTVLVSKDIFDGDFKIIAIRALYDLFTKGDYKISLLMNLTGNLDMLDPKKWIYESEDVYSLIITIIRIMNLEYIMRSCLKFKIYPEDVIGYNCVIVEVDEYSCNLYYWDEENNEVYEKVMPIFEVEDNLLNGKFEHISIKGGKISFE